MIPAKSMDVRTTSEHLAAIDRSASSVYVLHEKYERRFPVHNHVKGQLTYVDGGIAYVHVEKNTLVIPARHYIWIPAGMDHFLQVGPSATAIRNIYFSLGNQEPPFYNEMGIYPVNNLLHEMILFTERCSGDVEPTNIHYVFLAGIKNILPELSPRHLPTALPTTQHVRLRPILQYLNAHAAEVLTLGTVSTAFDLSERSLSRLFQTVLSISFLQYLKQLRMVKAVELMLRKDLTLSQIAYATGYNSISAFSNTFYQLTQVRPSQFCQAIRSGNSTPDQTAVAV
ncbi:helix-turn-helix domain-containing protein [Pedobacter duraquae]|uniref:AraC family transcriptional regulator n=1 Tax=Pedobacter duraquae TaxID=425511 RepID=A0A4R6IL68_9SPHI|nr:AraC family transcriptional regulator [Pedobacter duraquae]TDO22864.1 AraC family transcriptional regulator [Pedobacter duraquae]